MADAARYNAGPVSTGTTDVGLPVVVESVATLLEQCSQPDARHGKWILGQMARDLRAALAAVPAGEATDDPFGTTCLDCGEAVTDTRPAGETPDGPVHYGCGDTGGAATPAERRRIAATWAGWAQAGRLRVERDALSSMLRGMARRASLQRRRRKVYGAGWRRTVAQVAAVRALAKDAMKLPTFDDPCPADGRVSPRAILAALGGSAETADGAAADFSSTDKLSVDEKGPQSPAPTARGAAGPDVNLSTRTRQQ